MKNRRTKKNHFIKKDDSYSIDVFSSYGECKAYEKAIVQKQEITDWSYYVKLKDPAEKK